MSKSLTLHPEHGVNPALCICFWCGTRETGIALLGYNGGKEAPRHVIIDYDPCDECKSQMESGIAFIEASKTPFKPTQPELARGAGIYPTGRWLVMKRESLKKILDEDGETYKKAMAHGRCYIDQETFDALAPPEEATEGLRNMVPQGHA
jgi:hypothetical protein